MNLNITTAYTSVMPVIWKLFVIIEFNNFKYYFDYVESHVKMMKLSIETAIGKVLARVEKILKFIFEGSVKIDKKKFIEVTV